MPKDKIAAFFEDYKKTFVQANIEKISEFFHYPCIIAKAGSPVTGLNTPAELQQFEQASLDYFESIQLKKADIEVTSFQEFAGGNIICNATFDLFGPDNAVLGQIKWVYHVLDIEGKLKILTAHFVS
ncbi:MAG: hypothetical protein ABUK01_16835 [Leptospirales bacterium]